MKAIIHVLGYPSVTIRRGSLQKVKETIQRQGSNHNLNYCLDAFTYFPPNHAKKGQVLHHTRHFFSADHEQLSSTLIKSNFQY